MRLPIIPCPLCALRRIAERHNAQAAANAARPLIPEQRSAS